MKDSTAENLTILIMVLTVCTVVCRVVCIWVTPATPLRLVQDEYQECRQHSEICEVIIGHEYSTCNIDVEKAQVCEKIFVEQMATIKPCGAK